MTDQEMTTQLNTIFQRLKADYDAADTSDSYNGVAQADWDTINEIVTAKYQAVMHGGAPLPELKPLFELLSRDIEDSGGCDHSVGICACRDSAIAETVGVAAGAIRVYKCPKRGHGYWADVFGVNGCEECFAEAEAAADEWEDQ